MKVAEIMTREVAIASPDQTIGEVAREMATNDIGFMPVGENDRLVGTITDRDIAIRGVGNGLDGEALVRDLMSPSVKYCFEDQDVESVVQNMGDIKLRRLPVVDSNKRLVGVVALADAALKESPESVGIAMSGVTQPGGVHSQSL